MISLLCTLALGWQDNPPKNEPPKKTPVPTVISAQAAPKQSEALPGFAEIKKTYDQIMQQSSEIYTKAKTPEEKEAALEKDMELFQKEGKPLVEKAMVLARAQAIDKRAIPVLVWVLRSVPFVPQTEDEAADLMIKHHPQSLELFQAAEFFSRHPTDWSVKVMQTFSEKAESADDRAKAKYRLAEMYHNLAEEPAFMQSLDEKTRKRFERQQGKAYFDRLRTVDCAALNAQAEKLLEEIVAKHADVKMYSQTLGEMARSYLFEIRNLAIGKAAPEIIGEDIDGKPMKLSDYRGKVVVLDFWGFW